MKNRTLLGLGLASIFTIFCGAKAGALTITEDYTLTEDIAERVIVTGGSDVSINMNGHNIVTAGNGALTISGAKVTLSGTGLIQSTNSNGITITDGSLTMSDGISVKSQEFGVFTSKDSSFTMNGGTITTVDNCGVGGNGSNGLGGYTININGGTINANITSAGYVSCGVYHPNTGTVNMTGGTINSSNGAGIVQRGGVLNITGGTINAQGSSTGKVGDAPIMINASAVVIDKSANYPGAATLSSKISGATLSGTAKAVHTIGENTVIELTGGIYNKEPDEGTLPEGYGAYQVIGGDCDGKWVIVKESDLELKVIGGIIGEGDVNEDDLALIAEAVEGKYTVAGYYDILLAQITKDGDVVGYVSEVDELVDVNVNKPGDMPEVKDGYERKLVIVRTHGGEADIITDVTDKGEAVEFGSKLFSTYALAYVDTKKQDNNNNNSGNTSTDENKPTETQNGGASSTTKPEEVKTTKKGDNVNNPDTFDDSKDLFSMLWISAFGLIFALAIGKKH
ncbi:hypothetical protein IK110_03580 [Candidatus Saccharibacteria bacterium]|nr:hypothetical protein [Candidatus Saccharibacteria bacterium]